MVKFKSSQGRGGTAKRAQHFAACIACGNFFRLFWNCLWWWSMIYSHLRFAHNFNSLQTLPNWKNAWLSKVDGSRFYTNIFPQEPMQLIHGIFWRLWCQTSSPICSWLWKLGFLLGISCKIYLHVFPGNAVCSSKLSSKLIGGSEWKYDYEAS